MKKNINFSKFKKIILVILCSITLFFSMPVKSKADFWESLVDVVLKLPDAVMRILNNQISGQPVTKFKINLNLKGWDDETRGSIYNFEITPYDIFTSGLEAEYTDRDGNVVGTYTKIPLLDINFFDKDNENVAKDSANILRPVIANIYKSLRNLVLVLMMVILLYVGIRIIVSTAVTDQVKYKQWLMDWVVGICLLLLMQYIMSFLMNVNEIVLEMLGDNKEASYYISLSKLGGGIDLSENSWGSVSDKATKGNSDYEASYEYFFNKHLDIANSNGGGDINSEGNYNFNSDTGTINVDSRKDWGDNGNVFINARIFRFSDTGKNTAIVWGTGIAVGLINPILGGLATWGASAAVGEDNETDWADKTVYRCNLMEYIRTITTFGSKYVYIYTGSGSYSTFTNSEEVDKGDSVFMGYAILYLLLVIETCMFLYTYIKRVFKLAFYTMIAPLIAFMYPIDKLGDGKAQAFNTWFKEYLFNVLIQPLHLLLYTVFIYAAMELMQESIIYAIGAYAYMIAAEKFFKKIFGFDKAPGGAPSGLANPAVGGAAMRGLDKLAGVGPGAKGGKDGKKDSGASGSKIKLAKKKLPGATPTGSGTPHSSGIPGSSGGSGGGSFGGGESGGSSSGTPGAPGRGNRSGKGFWDAARERRSRKIGRAITGGRADSIGQAFKGNKLDMLKTGGKFVGRNVRKAGSRLAGGALGLGAGILAGTIASAVTGEDQFGKGIYAGTKVGWNRGGQIGDWAAEKAGNWYDENRRLQASDENNTGLAADLRLDDLRKEAPEAFAGRSVDEINALHDALEYGDIKAEDLDDMFDCLERADNAEEAYDTYKTNSKFDLSDAKKFEDAVNYEAKYNKEIGKAVEAEKGQLSMDIDKQYAEEEAAKKAEIDDQIAEREYKQKKLEQEINKILNKRNPTDSDRNELGRYQRQQSKNEKQIGSLQAEKTHMDSDEYRQQRDASKSKAIEQAILERKKEEARKIMERKKYIYKK